MAVPASPFQNRRYMYFTQLYEPSSKPHYRNLALQQIIQTQNAGASASVCAVSGHCAVHVGVSAESGARSPLRASHITHRAFLMAFVTAPEEEEKELLPDSH